MKSDKTEESLREIVRHDSLVDGSSRLRAGWFSTRARAHARIDLAPPAKSARDRY
jgi:hypothetical protein